MDTGLVGQLRTGATISDAGSLLKIEDAQHPGIEEDKSGARGQAVLVALFSSSSNTISHPGTTHTVHLADAISQAACLALSATAHSL